MLLTIEKTVTEKQQVEIKLPAYFIDNYEHFVYMIAEDESLITAGSNLLCVTKKGTSHYAGDVQKAMSLTPTTSTAFNERYATCIATINNSVVALEDLPY